MICIDRHSISLELEGKKIGLDSNSEIAFVSHAHSDHAAKARKTKKLISSDATFDLMKTRDYKVNGRAENAEIDAHGIKLLNAGHCLGSNQLHMQVGDKLFTYTGDFKLRDSFTSKGADAKECDVLLMECTYGDKNYIFPKREEVYGQIKTWIENGQKKGKNLVLGGYSLGKAQELIKMLNEFKITPIVNKSIYEICEVYGKHGIKLETIFSESPEGQEMLKRQFTAVLPMHQVSWGLAKNLETVFKRKIDLALATGWSKTISSMQSFCMSDHADYNELMQYVERANPKKVICAFGFDENFAKELQKKGYNAVPLTDLKKEKNAPQAIQAKLTA